MYVQLCKCTCGCVYMSVWVCLYVCLDEWMYRVYGCIGSMYVCRFAIMYVSIYVYKYACMFVKDLSLPIPSLVPLHL